MHMSERPSTNLHAVRPRHVVLVATLAGLLSLVLLAAARLALAEPSAAAEKSSDDSNRPLDPEEGRRSFQRRLRHAEAAKPGHVADAEGMPIAGATVKRSDSAWNATTDANGAFPLPEVKPGESMQLHVSAPGFLPLENAYLCRTAEGQYYLSGEWPIRLARPSTLFGRVLGPDGKPLVGASLSITTWSRNYVKSNQCRVTTDALGRFTFENIPPGSHTIYYPGEPAQSVPAKGVYGSLIVEPADGHNLKDLTIDLSQSTASVEGQVFGPDGKLLADTKVILCRYHEWKENGSSGGAGPYAIVPATDNQGRYKLTGIGPGQWEIRPYHTRYQRPSPHQLVTLAPKQSVRQNLQVPERNDPENDITRAANLAERADDLGKLNLCVYSYCAIPSVDHELASSDRFIFISLVPGQIDTTYVERKGLGLPPNATPETVAATAHVGELYFVAPNTLVTVNGTIVAPLTPPANGSPATFPSWIAGMKRTQIIKQVEAFRRRTPETDGRRIIVEKGQQYIVVRNDGRAFVMQIGEVGKGGISPSLLYVGRLRLAKSSDVKSNPAPSPKTRAK